MKVGGILIPKIIHYCWFGYAERPKSALKCIESWKKYCPDYKIIEWNESNFDINTNGYTKMCYEKKKYAFLSDYVRLIVVNNQGGIYMDTDVEMIRSFDPLLKNKAFFGFETKHFANTGQGFGAEPNTEIVKTMIKEYSTIQDGNHGTIGCPNLNSQALTKFGFTMNGDFQMIDNVALFPSDYFNPYDDSTGILSKTENTYSIHWYGKSWMKKTRILRNRIARIYHRVQKKISWK